MLDEKDPLETNEEFEHIVDAVEEDEFDDDDDNLDDDETEEIVSDIISKNKKSPLCGITIAFYILAALTFLSSVYSVVKNFTDAKAGGQPIVMSFNIFIQIVLIFIQTCFSVAVLYGIGYMINYLKNKNK